MDEKRRCFASTLETGMQYGHKLGALFYVTRKECIQLLASATNTAGEQAPRLH